MQAAALLILLNMKEKLIFLDRFPSFKLKYFCLILQQENFASRKSENIFFLFLHVCSSSQTMHTFSPDLVLDLSYQVQFVFMRICFLLHVSPNLRKVYIFNLVMQLTI